MTILSKFNELKKPTDLKYLLLTTFLSAGVILAPILSNRILDVYSLKITLGTVLVTVMYGLIDVINNDYGIVKARLSILASTITKIFAAFAIAALLLIPFFKETPGFIDVIKSAFRIEFASMMSMFISQYFIDVKIFDFFRKKYDSFFIRYTLSNTSQIIGISIFGFIAFYGTGLNLGQVILGNIIVRFGLQFILTPVYSFLTYKKPKESLS